MRKKLEFIFFVVVVFVILILGFWFSFSKDDSVYVLELSNLFKTYYYPSKNIQIIVDDSNDEESNKIVIKNTTQESYLYQIRVKGEDVSNIYLRYKKEDGKLSDYIYLNNLGEDRIVVENQYMESGGEDTYVFYVYSKSHQDVSNLSFVVEELTIPEDNIRDVMPPVITLNGENEMTIYQNEEFVDPGIASISDDYDESISLDKVKVVYQIEENGSFRGVEKIDTSIIGNYYIHYHVFDSARNEADVVRIVHVIANDEEETDLDASQEELVVDVTYSTYSMTTEPVVVTITANEPLIALDGWILSRDELKLTKTFSSNVSGDVVVLAKSGRSVITKIIIQNIDKSELNTDGEVDNSSNDEISVKLSTKEYGTNYINLSFVVSFDKDIREYSYTCDGDNWQVTKEKSIVCNNLSHNTTYNVQVKVLTKNGNTYYSNIVTKTTMALSNPVFSVVDENEWSKIKEVVINYAKKLNGISYYYKVDGDWVEVSSELVTIEVLKNQTIYAKITDGFNEVIVSYDVGYIDNEGPSMGDKSLSESILRTNKIRLNWEKATDLSTSEDELVYYICKNKDFDTCLNNPDAKLNNIDTYTFSSLSPNTTYSFQVIVFDKLGNYSVYDMVELKTKELYDISDKSGLVAIMYSTWFNPISNNPPNISNILAGLESWGAVNQFHYWAKPALGYYRSDDKSVIRKHMLQLESAGIDFIIVDNTNANINAWGYGEGSYWYEMVTSPLKALTDVSREMRDEGYDVPYIVNWIGTSGGWETTNKIYEDFYNNPDNQGLWVYWDNLPFVITTTGITNPSVNIYTRHMWGLQPSLAIQEWSYLQIDNNKPSYNSNGSVEQIGVSVAMQRDYMSNTALAVGRNHGITFYNQWMNAFRYRPKVVTVTWWNEWAAQRLYINGKYVFTDNYNQEYSRDIEPMEGGHGDQYYRWLKQYISAYKSGSSCPRLVEDGY